ncbi:MAG: hypothetical protein ING69_01040 [Rhodocyclaceae bacterium]|jgi:hypothetical protein|nr:hypothetical protein [Rhodocyclaceae bacterium]
MHRPFQLIMCGLLLVWVVGCASTRPESERRQTLSSPKSVAIITATGRTAEIAYVGVTVFNNYTKTVDIADWKLDSQIAAAIKSRLPSSWSVVREEYAPSLEEVFYSPRQERGLRADHGERVLYPHLDDFLRRVPVDIVIYALKANYPALRVANGRAAMSFDQVQVVLGVTIIDGKTRQEIFGTRRGLRCEPTSFPFDASDVASALARGRESYERQWLACLSKNMDNFFQLATQE